MKLQCKQCGALLAVTSPDAYITCPYCGSKSVVAGYRGNNFLHRPALTKEDVLRLFTSGRIASVSLFWFPYDPDTLERIFTQPYSELEHYSPPSADRRMWNQSEVEGEVVPVDPDLLGEAGVLYHPFWIAIDAASALGTIVDGVSGRIPGASALPAEQSSFDPIREAFSAFTIAVVPTLLVFFLLKGVSVFWASVLGMTTAILSPGLFRKLMRREG